MPTDAEAQNRVEMVERNQQAILRAKKANAPSLEAIANNLKTQDNRITANPIFIVEQLKRVYGVGSAWTEAFVWMTDEGDEASPEIAKAFEIVHRENGADQIDDFHRVGYKEYWQAVQPFFTEAAANRYIRANGHNLNKTRVYVYGGWRNDEWYAIREHLLTFATVEAEAV